MLVILARILALLSGWVAALLLALLAGLLLAAPKIPVLLLSGAIWTCLLLVQ